MNPTDDCVEAEPAAVAGIISLDMTDLLGVQN